MASAFHLGCNCLRGRLRARASNRLTAAPRHWGTYLWADTDYIVDDSESEDSRASGLSDSEDQWSG